MTRWNDRPVPLTPAGLNLIRIMIASYFLAVSLGIIAGTRIDLIFASFLHPSLAQIVGHAILFTLSFLLICGLAIRFSALTMGALVFWSSFIGAEQGVSVTALDDFWRDLALIGALMLTYQPGGYRSMDDAAIVHRRRFVRRLTPGQKVRPRRILPDALPEVPVPPLQEAIVARRNRQPGGTVSMQSLAAEIRLASEAAIPDPGQSIRGKPKPET